MLMKNYIPILKFFVDFLFASLLLQAQPPNGPLAGIFSVHDQTYTPRHCNYYLSVNQMEDGNNDFMFVLVNALNGNANVST